VMMSGVSSCASMGEPEEPTPVSRRSFIPAAIFFLKAQKKKLTHWPAQKEGFILEQV
jgi:hypothetical protein